QLVFHDICSPSASCDYYSIPPAQFNTLLDFIAGQSGNGVVVRTVGQVMSGSSPTDLTPPTTTISCNGTSCSGGYYNAPAPVAAALAATDNAGGSGVSAIRYTTDGSTPTQSGAGGTTYTAPFTVSSSATVKYRAFDVANNAEATKSQALQIDTVAPTSSIKCN